MLPVALSEVLGISVSEVMERYFNGLEEDVRVHRIQEALDHKRLEHEGDEWLAEEAHCLSLNLESTHRGGDDTF
jgi:hypothetical protein